VSRSLLAKLEKKLVNASYGKVKDIFDALEALEAERANDAMIVAVGRIHNSKIEYAFASETIHAVWERMDRKAYSQLPVKDAASIVGSITERAISRKMAEVGPEKIRNIKVCELMEDPLPIVSVKTPTRDVVPLLQIYQAVLTQERGEVAGIVTNADVAKLLLQTERRGSIS
jgi:predicted transcriptional regulator